MQSELRDTWSSSRRHDQRPSRLTSHMLGQHAHWLGTDDTGTQEGIEGPDTIQTRTTRQHTHSTNAWSPRHRHTLQSSHTTQHLNSIALRNVYIILIPHTFDRQNSGCIPMLIASAFGPGNPSPNWISSPVDLWMHDFVSLWRTTCLT